MTVAAPDPVVSGPLRRLRSDLRDERAFDGALPPGPTDFSVARTRAFARNPLPLLLEAYRAHGPVFSMRILHASGVFVLGPEANHYVTVSHAHNFRWREGSMGDLIPFLGDGLLTTDGDYHRRSRKVMLPAFHRERLLQAAAIMVAETQRAVASWSPGDRVDLYAWARALALRIALKALFGIDPDRSASEGAMAREFERGLGYYGRDYFLQTLRGPATPFSQMRQARARLTAILHEQIARRRNGHGSGDDVLGLLIDANDEDGRCFSDQQVCDQAMTLLFAGHDTATSTVAFLFHELARAPRELEALLSEGGDVALDPEALHGGLPRLEMAIDETLRLYPPAWIGPRRALESFELAGHHIPGGAHVNYCSWASHHLPEVFPDPEAFVPERMSPANRAALPKGAYVPFGGGSRTCIGMRFGQLEVKAVAATVLRRFRLELEAGYTLSVRQMPTLSPRGGLPMVVRAAG